MCLYKSENTMYISYLKMDLEMTWEVYLHDNMQLHAPIPSCNFMSMIFSTPHDGFLDDISIDDWEY